MTVKIRGAIHEDMDWITSELRDFAKHYGSKHSLFGDEAQVRETFLNLITNNIVIVAENEVEPIGFIAGGKSPHPYNPKIMVLYELFWWIKEKYRRGRASVLLLNAFTDWGKKNADWIVMTIESTTPISDRSLLKRGYNIKEKSYILEV